VNNRRVRTLGAVQRRGRRTGWAALGVLIAVGATGAPPAGGGGAARLVPVRILVDGLRRPVHVVPAPTGRKGRLFVAEQGGRVLIAQDERLLTRPFVDLRGTVARGGLRGLLSFAFHPRYVANGLAYVYYVGRDGAVYVAEIRTARGYAASRRVLLRIPVSRRPYAHYGGHIAFGPDGLLYVAIGDGDVPRTAQDAGTLLGKIVRLRVQRRNPTPEVVAWGLRNPWRFSFTHDGSALMVGDVGANRREEIDLVPRRLFGRADLGWPQFEGSVRRARTEADPRGVLVAPLAEYPHARRDRCYSVVGGFVYRGSLFPRLRGRYVYGDLCGGMWSVRLRAPGARRPRAEPFAASGILTSIVEGPDRELLLVSGDGKVLSPVPR
jgi:glucose/arabinose dehydrogenase